jgi:hypothetical protein
LVPATLTSAVAALSGAATAKAAPANRAETEARMIIPLFSGPENSPA